ncbi:MAG TPA: hypothetical protein VD907_00610 [Verrucomicrobiae bacterium]|nr:hypothetical protein [Verrucomicrobiae bacterium]
MAWITRSYDVETGVKRYAYTSDTTLTPKGQQVLSSNIERIIGISEVLSTSTIGCAVRQEGGYAWSDLDDEINTVFQTVAGMQGCTR